MTPARESNTAYLCERTAGGEDSPDAGPLGEGAEAMSDEKSASPVCAVSSLRDHRGKKRSAGEGRIVVHVVRPWILRGDDSPEAWTKEVAAMTKEIESNWLTLPPQAARRDPLT